jgi:hypothetical protein
VFYVKIINAKTNTLKSVQMAKDQ